MKGDIIFSGPKDLCVGKWLDCYCNYQLLVYRYLVNYFKKFSKYCIIKVTITETAVNYVDLYTNEMKYVAFTELVKKQETLKNGSR